MNTAIANTSGRVVKNLMSYSPSSGCDFESHRHKRRISGQTKHRSSPSAAGVTATQTENCLDPVAHLNSIASCLHESVSQQKLQKHRERNLLKLRQLCRTSGPCPVQALYQTRRRERQGSPTSTEPLPPRSSASTWRTPPLQQPRNCSNTQVFALCPLPFLPLSWAFNILILLFLKFYVLITLLTFM